MYNKSSAFEYPLIDFPGKPFDLFFQNLMEELVDQTAERGVQLERARQVFDY